MFTKEPIKQQDRKWQKALLTMLDVMLKLSESVEGEPVSARYLYMK